ncbi:MAG: potassium channel family protein, partial [Dehalococcoidia bacterium]
YFSGTSFFTLGLGDFAPRTSSARLAGVIEAGTGFGFLALVIGYLPVLYQAFSRRESSISLLDARAGSPPCALELLRRYGIDNEPEGIGQLLQEWERWAADLMESHLSYPLLAYYRSQHDNQSWIAALTTILDASALVIAGIERVPLHPARLTFALARHAAVDMSQVFNQQPQNPARDRLPPGDLLRLRATLSSANLAIRSGAAMDEKLAELRSMYEPYVNALSIYLLMPLPLWLPSPDAADDWQASAWDRSRAMPLR